MPPPAGVLIIVGVFGESGRRVIEQPTSRLGNRDYADVVGALVEVRRFACEMSDAADAARSAQPEDEGACAMIDAVDSALAALRYDPS